MHHQHHFFTFAPLLALLNSCQAQTIGERFGALGEGIELYGGQQELQRYLSASVSPNATGNASSQVYVYSDRQPTRAVAVNPFNETDPYAHALTVNLSKVDLGTLAYQNASTVNQVFELTLSDYNIQRLVASNRSLCMSISPGITVNQTADSHSYNGSCMAILGDSCLAALATRFSSSQLPSRLADMPACAAEATFVQIPSTTSLVALPSFYNNSLNFNTTNPDSRGFYYETSSLSSSVNIYTRFNHSGYGQGFDFPTRSTLFFYTSPATAASNFSMYDYALSHFNIIFIGERANSINNSISSPNWVAAYCIRADNVVVGSRRPFAGSSANRALSLPGFLGVAGLVASLLICI